MIDLGQEPHHECAEELGPVLHVGHFEDADQAAAGAHLEQVFDVELGLAEERVRALLLELDDLAQDHSDGGAREPTVLGHRLLASIAVEEVQRCAQVRQVDKWKLLIVRVFEDSPASH